MNLEGILNIASSILVIALVAVILNPKNKTVSVIGATAGGLAQDINAAQTV